MGQRRREGVEERGGGGGEGGGVDCADGREQEKGAVVIKTF